MMRRWLTMTTEETRALIADARKAALNADWFRGNGALISKLADALEARQVDEAAVRADAVRETARYIDRLHPKGLTDKTAVIADLEIAAERLGEGIHANGRERHEPEPRAKACSACGMDFDDCTGRIHGPENKACCSRCAYTDTHDDPALKPEPVAPQPSERDRDYLRKVVAKGAFEDYADYPLDGENALVERVTDAIIAEFPGLAAAPAETEWQYSRGVLLGDGLLVVGLGIPVEQVVEVRRRKAGPWLPVPGGKEAT